ncbi:MAG TPA: hypothetical protein VM869_30240 [Enhygromyxa sp.]|nr:hypothetical protein [Enhygromyxa sp.]
MMLDRDALWPELLIDAAKRARRDELVLALLAAIGGFLGLLVGACCLVWASAPPPLLRPAEGLMLLARVAAVVPVPAVLGGRLALQLGEQLLRWVRHS